MPNIKDIMVTAGKWAQKNAQKFNPNATRKTVSWKDTKKALGEFGRSNLGQEVATGLTAAAPAITGGNHMMAGDGLMGLGAVAGMVNPWLGLAVTAGGALMNAAFGSNVNQQAVKEYEDKLVDYSRPEITAQDNTQLLNQINSFEDFGHINKGDLGTQGWFNTDVDYAYNNLMQGVNAANASRAKLIDDAVTNVDKQNDARIAMNYRAFGGPMFGYMSDGAIAYDMARDNLMVKLWNAQNKSKGQPLSTSFAAGGLLSDNFTNGVIEVGAGGSHEKNPYSGVPMGVAEDGQPNLVEEGEAIYKDYVFSNRLKVPKAVRSKYKLRGPKEMTFAEAFINAQKESEERENDPISKNGLNNIAMILMQSQEEIRAKDSSRKKAKGGHLFSGLIPDPYEEEEEEVYTPPVGSLEWYDSLGNEDLIAGSIPGTYEGTFGVTNPVVVHTTTPPSAGGNSGESTKDKKDKTKLRTSSGIAANMLRFAEPAGNMFAVWSDATGRTNNPVTYDFIPNYTPLSFAPIGEYMPELHLDTRYAANQQAQQAAATRAAIMNTTTPNRWANLLAADYNAQNTYGTLLRDAELAEFDNLLKARTFNRATNQYNSEMGAKIAADDSQQRLAYAQARLAQAKANTDETNATMGAKARNIQALTTSLANVGRERDAYNWRDMLMRAGVFGTLSEKPTSWTDKQWNAYQENLRLIQEATAKACGGKLKKKGGFTY